MRTPPLPTYRCPRVRAFSVEGDRMQAPWKQAPAVRLGSATGAPQRLQPTTLRACWSETHLYVAFASTDRRLRATFTRRDEALYDEDVVEVFLCPEGVLERYIELEFSPLGTIFDARVVNRKASGQGIAVDRAWDCDGLVCVPRTTPTGWSIEAAIPFAGLGVPAPKPGQRWRANFYRIDYERPVEYSAWSPTLVTPASYHEPARFGHLHFAEGAA